MRRIWQHMPSLFNSTDATLPLTHPLQASRSLVCDPAPPSSAGLQHPQHAARGDGPLPRPDPSQPWPEEHHYTQLPTSSKARAQLHHAAQELKQQQQQLMRRGWRDYKQLVPTELPLYYEGGWDRTRFVYAIYLLNKDIEQLLAAHGLSSAGSSSPLQNLYKLAVAAASAVPQRRSRLERSASGGHKQVVGVKPLPAKPGHMRTASM
jgi:hypothetical protein